MENSSLATLLQALTLAAVLWLFRSVQKLREDHVELRTILVGEKGDNGLRSEVRGARARLHSLSAYFQALRGRHALLAQRVGRIDHEDEPAYPSENLSPEGA